MSIRIPRVARNLYPDQVNEQSDNGVPFSKRLATPPMVGPEDPAHEKAVREFFANVAGERPVTFKAVCDKYPVLSEHQMRHRLRRQVPVGDQADVELVGRLLPYTG